LLLLLLLLLRPPPPLTPSFGSLYIPRGSWSKPSVEDAFLLQAERTFFGPLFHSDIAP
jgi:hypothetical protein